MNADKIPFPDKRPPIPLQSLFGTKPESTRQKALESRARVMEFASTIPKPLAKVKREVSFSNDDSQAAGQVRRAHVCFGSAPALLALPRDSCCVSGTVGVGNAGCQAHAQSRSRFGNTQPVGHLIGGSRLRNIVLSFRRLLLCAHNHKCGGSVLLQLAGASALDTTTLLQPQPLLEVCLVYK